MRIARGISIANTSKPISTAAAFDADAAAFFTAASITDNTQKSAVNQLVLDLKSASIWTKMKALYPVVGGVASAHAVNLKTPGTYNLSFGTGWTHSSTGMTPNGATYADTSLIPSLHMASSLNSTHLSIYSRTSSIISGQRDMAAYVGGSTPAMGLGTNTGVYLSDSYSFTTNRITGTIASAAAFFIGNRTSSTTHKLFRNGTQLGSTDSVSNSNILPSINIYLGAANQNPNVIPVAAYSSKQIAFASIGDGLTDAEASSFYSAVQTYQTTLARQV